MEAHEMSSQEQDGLAGDVMEDMGLSQNVEHEMNESSDQQGEESDSGSSKKREPGWQRLKRKNREHEMEIRELRSRIEQMQSSQHLPEHSQQANSYYAQPHEGHGIDEQIHKAVSYALHHKEMEERKAREAEHAQHVHRQYQDLHKHLDHLSDKYDDFEEVVRGQDVPYTSHMRDAALLLDKSGPGSAGEVLYKLGKNPDELKRISQLHPLEQAREMVKLSHALISGSSQNNAAPRNHLGNIKSNPVQANHAITEKTSVGDLRRKMKAGWK